MAFIRTIDEQAATGQLAEFYDQSRESMGYVPDYLKVFSLRPEVFAAWRSLVKAVMANMDDRRFELATLAAARKLRSSYCSLAHGKRLRDEHLSTEQLRAVVVDRRDAGLDEVDVAVMDLAEQVAEDAYEVTEADIARLRELGLEDAEIADVVFAAAIRSFFSKVLDALGAEPDAAYLELEPELQEVLAVGRPIAPAGSGSS